MEIVHEPVLIGEIINLLNNNLLNKSPVVIDGTLGLGGYAEAVLKNFAGCKLLIGVDRDCDALSIARERLKNFENFQALHGNFSNLKEILLNNNLNNLKIDALLFDLGVSNMQLIKPERGFSFNQDGPLDLRMDYLNEDSLTAEQVLKILDAKELARIFRNYGDEKFAFKIAAGIKEHLKFNKSLESTQELANLIRKILPEPVQRKMGGHPARRVFQALRIYVNNELDELEGMLKNIEMLYELNLINDNCILIIVSYHSLEDRIVKYKFRDWNKILGEIITRHPVVPSDEEVERNYKSRSAKLRAFRFKLKF
ncbi:MAG: 16S rRNA (cytosine(1402)-N(4))-methyltransferase RsmH [Synergistaceae bacterium]|nr:16S rRNA (cytosine(1402)-N(4))-methyltransferase RsmH [Synergistaceae bacterium]